MLTLTGSASVADYQTALDSITYSFTPSNGDPTGGGSDTTRTISWVANDGSRHGSNAAATSTLDTVHVAPTVVAGATATYEIGGPASALDATLSVSDVDSGGNLNGATVSIGTGFVSGGDTLNFTNQNGITGSYNATTGMLMLSGSASVADYHTALDSITFSSTVTTAGSRTIDWSVTDGVESSSQVTSTVNLQLGPQVTAGATATFTGGGSPVLLDCALSVTDTSSPTLASATVSISAGLIAGDTLNFTPQNGITVLSNSGGVLMLTGTASVADYQAALDSITYSFSPSNGDPTGGGDGTTRTISWVVNDGVTSSAAVTSTLDTVHVAPTVTAGATVSYELGSPAVALDAALAVSDGDSGGNLAGATVAIGTGFVASDDTLNFTNQNGISGSYNATTGMLMLTGTASVIDYQAALDSITFSSTVSSGGTRTIDWTVTDGVKSSTQVTSTVDLGVGPQVTAGATATFTGGGSPVLLDSALSVTDTSSPTLASATVSISAGLIAGDTLNFTPQNGITVLSNSGGVLMLTGTASVADYQAALDFDHLQFLTEQRRPDRRRRRHHADHQLGGQRRRHLKCRRHQHARHRACRPDCHGRRHGEL